MFKYHVSELISTQRKKQLFEGVKEQQQCGSAKASTSVERSGT